MIFDYANEKNEFTIYQLFLYFIDKLIFIFLNFHFLHLKYLSFLKFFCIVRLLSLIIIRIFYIYEQVFAPFLTDLTINYYVTVIVYLTSNFHFLMLNKLS